MLNEPYPNARNKDNPVNVSLKSWRRALGEQIEGDVVLKGRR